MNPAGYMAKRVVSRPEWIKAPHVTSIYSVSGCISENFADYVPFWKHNGFWLFDSVEIIREVAAEPAIDLTGCKFFYYEVFELEFDDETKQWRPHEPDGSFTTRVVPPASKRLEGFDVVTFYARNAPEHSPLSCNNLAETIPVNAHCLLESFDVARMLVDSAAFENSEPGPYRIFSVYSCA
jgi:hypothetical protein